jgi:hypothetical protein
MQQIFFSPYQVEHGVSDAKVLQWTEEDYRLYKQNLGPSPPPTGHAHKLSPEIPALSGELKAGPSELKAGPSELKAGPSELKAGPNELKSGHSEQKAGPSELKASPSELKAGPSLIAGTSSSATIPSLAQPTALQVEGPRNSGEKVLRENISKAHELKGGGWG